MAIQSQLEKGRRCILRGWKLGDLLDHQTFQVPKMEGFLNLIRVFGGEGSPYISRIHTAYVDEYLHFRYL